MTDRAAFVKGLHRIADAIEAGESVPLPSFAWVMVFHAGPCDPAGVEAIARSLGVEDGSTELLAEEEGGLGWLRLRGHVAGVPVQVTGDAGPVLEPLSDDDPSVIRRTYALGGAA
jgi:hypothetical protein